MTLWNSLRETLASAFCNLRLWLLHLLGNAVILLVGYFWLHIPDEAWWQLMFTVVVAVIALLMIVVLHGGTMNYLLDRARNKDQAALATAMKRAASGLLPLLIWGIVFLWVRSQVDHLDHYQYSFPGWLRSEMPAWLRRMFSEPKIDNCFLAFVGFLRWILIPGVLLPLGLLCADLGFKGLVRFKTWLRMLRPLAWWIALIAATLIGVYLSGKLLDWTLSEKASFMQEKIWLGARLIVFYPMVIAAWLLTYAALAGSRMKADATPAPEAPAEARPVKNDGGAAAPAPAKL